MKLKIELTKKLPLNGQAEECIHGLKYRIRKCFKILAGKREHEVWLEFLPVVNKPPLTRIFRAVTHPDNTDLLEAVLKVLSYHVWKLQYPGKPEPLAEYLWEEEAVRQIWPDLVSLTRSLEKEERRLAEFIHNVHGKYKINLFVTSRRKAAGIKNTEGKSPSGQQIDALKPVLDGQEPEATEEPGERPRVAYRPVRKPFFGYIDKLGFRHGTPSEIVRVGCKNEKPERLYLDLESKQLVLENPKFFRKRVLKFNYHPRYPNVVFFESHEKKGDMS